MSIREQTGKRIRELRAKTPYTQEALSEKIGLGENAVGNMERGLTFPAPENLISLANEFHCTVADLVVYVETEYSPEPEIHAMHVQIKDRLQGFDANQLRLIIDMLDAARDRLDINNTEE